MPRATVTFPVARCHVAVHPLGNFCAMPPDTAYSSVTGKPQPCSCPALDHAEPIPPLSLTTCVPPRGEYMARKRALPWWKSWYAPPERGFSAITGYPHARSRPAARYALPMPVPHFTGCAPVCELQ